MTRLNNSPFLAMLLVAAALPILAVAQEQDAAAPAETLRWFKVELLVFSNESQAAAGAEQWQATPELTYPEPLRFLVDENLYASRAAEYEADFQIDPTGRQILEDHLEQATPPVDTAPGGADTSANSAGTTTDNPPRLPTPFITLPEAQREFADKAARMNRSGRYSVLFHESWVQPVKSQSVALPISLDRSGDTLEWPRLQGSVTLHLSRYLHINTNLWLNTAGSYLPGSWQMPAPPFAPVSLLGEEFPDFEETKMALAEARGALLPVTETGLPDTTDPSDAPLGTAVPGLPTGLPTAIETGSPGTTEELVPGQQELAPHYPFRHAVRLQQSRKMRSNEVHYIDHPMMGVIVKFTPLDEEDLELLATPGTQ